MAKKNKNRSRAAMGNQSAKKDNPLDDAINFRCRSEDKKRIKEYLTRQGVGYSDFIVPIALEYIEKETEQCTK